MPTSLFLLGHTHGAATVSRGLSVLILGPAVPSTSLCGPKSSSVPSGLHRACHPDHSQDLAVFSILHILLSGILYYHRFCISDHTSHLTPSELSCPLLRSVHFLQHHTRTFAPSLTAVRVKTIFHHSLMLVWRSLIARNVVCRPPMEESKGLALILKSKNIVMMKIAVNVSRYLL